jgi:processive 1,2-diacylglycerol beta-glucosyltransferase
MKRRVLILTAGYGEGHNSAARGLAAAFAERPDIEPEIIDVFALRAPLLNRWTRKGYLSLINTVPAMWSTTYRWFDRSTQAPRLFALLKSHRAMLGQLISARNPSAICSTYPVYPWLMQSLACCRDLPQFTVVTDAISINSLWFRVPASAWFVTDDDSAQLLRGRGIPAGKVRATGFPVGLEFADRTPALQPRDPRETRERRILYMINSGRAQALELATVLMQQPRSHLTITTGRDAVLKRQVESLARRAVAEVDVLGWTDRIPELLMTHHLVISKAGGATTQEAINAHCPMIVNQIVPGQEEGNFELLRRNDAGVFAATPQAIVATIEEAFRDDAAVWRRWRRNLARLARPDAARSIAREVIASLPAMALAGAASR